MCGIQSLILSHSWSPPNSEGPINNSRNFAQPGLESLLPFAGLPSTRVRSSPRRVILFDCFTSEALSCFQTHQTAADLRTCMCGTPKAWLSWVVHTVYLNYCAGRARFLITRTIPSERSRPLALSHFPPWYRHVGVEPRLRSGFSFTFSTTSRYCSSTGTQRLPSLRLTSFPAPHWKGCGAGLDTALGPEGGVCLHFLKQGFEVDNGCGKCSLEIAFWLKKKMKTNRIE